MATNSRDVLQRVIDRSIIGTNTNSRTLSDSDSARLSQWNNIAYTPAQWQSKRDNFNGINNSTIKLHCAYAESLVPENTRSDIFTGNPNDYLEMNGGYYSQHHRIGVIVAGDSMKYFNITSNDVQQEISQDTNIPIISNQREYNNYLNELCSRLFIERHPAEKVPAYFYTEIMYIAWFEGDTNVINGINNNDLLDHMNAIKIGESGSLFKFYKRMKSIHSHRCGAGDLYCVAYGIPLGWWGHNSAYLESVLHFKFVVANLSGEWHRPGPVQSHIHSEMHQLGLRGIQRGHIVDTIRRRDLGIPPIGIRQQAAGIVGDRGSIYLAKIEYPQSWIAEMTRVYTNLTQSNLSDHMKKRSLIYISTFLYHCKVGAIRGNLEDFRYGRGSHYLCTAPYKFKYILVPGFENVFTAEHQFGDFLNGPLYKLWILGEYFTFSSILLMKKALCTFINAQYQAVGQAIGGARGIQINDLIVHDLERVIDNGRSYTVHNMELSTIEELIERGVITTGDVRDYMTRNVYQFAHAE